MARRYAETVQVQADDTGLVAPSTFVWRGRSYLVSGVLGHWHERRAWWVGPAALALHGTGERGPGQAGSDLDGEREVWRVEASGSGGGVLGVYDLVHDTPGRLDQPGPGQPGPDQPAEARGAWRLLRVTD